MTFNQPTLKSACFIAFARQVTPELNVKEVCVVIRKKKTYVT